MQRMECHNRFIAGSTALYLSAITRWDIQLPPEPTPSKGVCLKVGGINMQGFENWWQQRSKGEIVALSIACYLLVALGSIDLGREVYQAIH